MKKLLNPAFGAFLVGFLTTLIIQNILEILVGTGLFLIAIFGFEL